MLEVPEVIQTYTSAPATQEAIEQSPQQKAYFLIPLEAIEQPTCLPVDRETVERLKAQIRAASEDPSAVNGLEDAVWIVMLEDGSLHIANGFHRYVALLELSTEFPDQFTPEIFTRVVLGSRIDLFMERLKGAGDHRAVAPARMAIFTNESWPYPVPFTIAIDYIEIDQSSWVHPEYPKEYLFDAVTMARFALDILQLKPEEALIFTQMGNGLAPDLIDHVRRHANLDRGEIPLNLAKELAGRSETMGDYALQHQVVKQMWEQSLSLTEATALIDALSQRQTENDAEPQRDLVQEQSRQQSTITRTQSPSKALRARPDQPTPIKSDELKRRPVSREASQATKRLFEVVAQNAALRKTTLVLAAEANIARFILEQEFETDQDRQEFTEALRQVPQLISLILMRDDRPLTAGEASDMVTAICSDLLSQWRADSQSARERITTELAEVEAQKRQIIAARMNNGRVSRAVARFRTSDARQLSLEEIELMREQLAQIIESLRKTERKVLNGSINGERKLRRQVSVLLEVVYSIIDRHDVPEHAMASILQEVDPTGVLSELIAFPEDFDPEWEEAEPWLT
ncbi:hypothetical protein JW766_03205 [Candidatus Dojkabacteria bacterium]|nr:hypothetical protein [Candidatus Dojkabacteria bacterium]